MNDTSSLSTATYNLDDQVGYLLRLVTQRHTTIFQSHTLDGLTPMQFSTLVRLSEQGRCSQNRLGRLAAMDVATIKGVVDRLRDKGLTQSEPDPDDKRRMLISLSHKGADLVERMKRQGKIITDETLAPLTEDEQQNLLTLLRKMT